MVLISRQCQWAPTRYIKLSMLGKNFSRHFRIFFPGKMIRNFKPDNLHEISNPIFWEKQEKIINLSSAELAQGALSVKTRKMVIGISLLSMAMLRCSNTVVNLSIRTPNLPYLF